MFIKVGTGSRGTGRVPCWITTSAIATRAIATPAAGLGVTTATATTSAAVSTSTSTNAAVTVTVTAFTATAPATATSTSTAFTATATAFTAAAALWEPRIVLAHDLTDQGAALGHLALEKAEHVVGDVDLPCPVAAEALVDELGERGEVVCGGAAVRVL